MAKTKRNHEDTWGASEPAKEKWESDNADAARKETDKRNESTARGEE
jgi:hypothetical protein